MDEEDGKPQASGDSMARGSSVSVSSSHNFLCHACQNIFSGDPLRFSQIFPNGVESQTQFPLHMTSVSFYDAVNKGCYICFRVHENIRYRMTNDMSTAKETPFITYEVAIWDSDTKPRAVLCIDYGHFRTIFPFYKTHYYPSPEYLPPRTDSPQSILTARQWMEKCSADHSSCGISRASSWTPTRVIDLGEGESTNWRLCVPEIDSFKDITYTTISYRWGGGEFMKLTKESFSSFRLGLPISHLPQAFQDAAYVTKQLGIRFLWIDSLCIIQNVEDDFNRECVQMSKIYSNTSCNIVATIGHDPHASLFQNRDYGPSQICKFKQFWKQNDQKDNPLLQFDAIVEEECMSREMKSSPIYPRGWILQELLLAPRALYFGKSQVHWACQIQEACEMWPDGNPTRIKMETASRLSNNDDYIKDPYHGWWTFVVERYSELEFTYTRDKMIALSGLATFFKERTGARYVAGMWMEQLPFSLNWWSMSRQYQSQQLDIYIAPTWSWASIHGEVRFPWNGGLTEYSRSILCSVSEVRVDTVDNDPAGRILAGQLTLQAPPSTTQAIESFCEADKRTSMYMLDRLKAHSDEHLEADLALTFADFQELKYRTDPEDAPFRCELVLHMIMLEASQSSPGFHVRVGASEFRLDFIEEKANNYSTLAALGLEIVDEETREVKVKDESFLRTFEII